MIDKCKNDVKGSFSFNFEKKKKKEEEGKEKRDIFKNKN